MSNSHKVTLGRMVRWKLVSVMRKLVLLAFRGKRLNKDGTPEERPFSQFGLYVYALCKIYRIRASEVARAAGISKGTLLELMRPYPGRTSTRPSQKTFWSIYSYFYAVIATDTQRHPTRKRVPSGWQYGMRSAALSSDLSPDILLLQLKEYVKAANPKDELVLPSEISAYSETELDDLEAHYAEGLAYIQELRRRSRQHP